MFRNHKNDGYIMTIGISHHSKNQPVIPSLWLNLIVEDGLLSKSNFMQLPWSLPKFLPHHIL